MVLRQVWTYPFNYFLKNTFHLTYLPVSYVQMTKDRHVIAWSSLKAFEGVASKANFEHHKMYLVAESIVKEVKTSVHVVLLLNASFI